MTTMDERTPFADDQQDIQNLLDTIRTTDHAPTSGPYHHPRTMTTATPYTTTVVDKMLTFARTYVIFLIPLVISPLLVALLNARREPKVREDGSPEPPPSRLERWKAFATSSLIVYLAFLSFYGMFLYFHTRSKSS
jgi:heme/copper-type cytochrome/quinol oxidase subunit 2